MSYIRVSNEKRHSAFSRLQNTLKYHVFFFSAAPLFRPAGSGKSPSFPFDRSMTTLSPRCDPQTLSFTIRPFRSPPSPLHDTRRTPRRAPAKTPLPPPSCRQRQDPLRPRRLPDPPKRHDRSRARRNRRRKPDRRTKEQGRNGREKNGPEAGPIARRTGRETGHQRIRRPPQSGKTARRTRGRVRDAPDGVSAVRRRARARRNRHGHVRSTARRARQGHMPENRPQHERRPRGRRRDRKKRPGNAVSRPPRLRRGFPPTPFRGASARRWGRRRRRNPGPRGRHWRRRTP